MPDQSGRATRGRAVADLMGSWFRYDPKVVGKHRWSQRSFDQVALRKAWIKSGSTQEVFRPQSNAAETLSRLFRINHYEAISIRHLDLRQGLSIHLVPCANNSIQIQDVCGNGIYLLVG